jgi:hypothetical protein
MRGIFVNDQKRFVSCPRVNTVPCHQGVKLNKRPGNGFSPRKLTHSLIGGSPRVSVGRRPFVLVGPNKAADLNLACFGAFNTRRRPGNKGLCYLHRITLFPSQDALKPRAR